MTPRFIALIVACLAVNAACNDAKPSPSPNDRRVILVMIDGLRWQEVFRGADDAHISKESGLIEDPGPVQVRYVRGTTAERRSALMPFLWSTVASEGEIWGNHDKQSHGIADNGVYVSYPGYSNTICGFADPAINSNAKIVNPNRSVFEWLNSLDGFKGRVCAFGTWDVFPFIFATERSGVPVDSGIEAFVPAGHDTTPSIALINRMRAEVPKRWGGSHFDALLFPVALEWLRIADPRAMFICLGETDEWAHEGRYADYLDAAHRADAYLAELWTTLQSMPSYRGKTTLIITADHGRGDGRREPRDWNNHGPKWPGSDEVWCAVIGPQTKARGELANADFVQGSIAATLAAAVGRDWTKEEPRAKPALAGAIDVGSR